jgi:uncharacterized protein (DUF1501 family)
MDRRDILKLITLGTLSLPLYLYGKQTTKLKGKHLILVELNGGNDGINTLIPYTDPLYYKLRPALAIEKNRLLPISKDLAFHPNMIKMQEIYKQGDMAIVQGVGYPHPNRSHFRSIEIWDTASDADTFLDQGWLNSIDTHSLDQLKGVVFGGIYGPLSGSSGQAIKINNIRRFMRQSKQIKGRISLVGDNPALYNILRTEAQIQQGAQLIKRSLDTAPELPHKYAKTLFARQLEAASGLIISGTEIPFFKLSLGSFDTHINQSRKHARLLTDLSEGIDALRSNLIKAGLWDDVLVVTYSEFGRRVAENASKGTDHGTAAPHFITGGIIKGGLYGKSPSLSDLNKNGDLKYTVDFRSIYHTIASRWIGSTPANLRKFSQVAFL